MPNLQQQMQQAFAALQGGNAALAEQICLGMLAEKGDVPDPLFLLGMIALQTGRLPQAEQWFARLVAIDPANAAAHNNLGGVLFQRKRHQQAVDSYDRAIGLKPDYAGAYNNRGAVLNELGRHQEAADSCAAALRMAPDNAEAHNNFGNALQGLERYAEALESYQRALTIRPDYADAHNNRGNALRTLGRHDEALESFAQALHFRPDHDEAYNSRGVVLSHARRYDEALDSFRLAVKINPRNAEAFNNRGNLLHDLRRYEEALEAYDQALAINPAYASAHSNRGNVLLELKRSEEALQALARVVELDPQYRFGKGKLLHAKMLCCDWSGYEDLCRSVAEDLHAGRKSAEPFGYQGISTSVADLYLCAKLYAEDRFPPAEKTLWDTGRAPNPKIRIGYLSGEFRTQATSILMAELFELHDKSHFEIFAFDNGWDDGSPLRARLNAAFDGIIDITGLGDVEAARRISDMNIDILVNLNGYFGRGRQGVFSYRPSPVQVNYLGFPGTIGADYIDYLIADAMVIPESDRAHYAEKIAYLPDCYQVNDSKRPIAGKMFTRQELGLPEDAFVYCCFNNNYKITPDTFDQWMRILQRVPRGVLWLFEDNPAASRNLRQEAERRGVDPGRLIFAGRLPPDQHLARHRAADLFLDTLPYNAHTTASDALWAGLPLLTCVGTTFPGRVAASLLNTMGLQQLVTASPEDYVEQAVALAADPVRMSGLRDVLEARRRTSPLFDTPRFARHIENVYRQMLERQRAGLPADHLFVRD
jgi:protein O-GlcNAc transferase